jgi:hypothetical protein
VFGREEALTGCDMAKMAELFTIDGQLLMVGRLEIIVREYERKTLSKRRLHYIKFEGRQYTGKDVEKLKGQ